MSGRGAGRTGTKVAKRVQKHNALVSRIQKNFSTATPQKRRRPSKKLATNLKSLIDALPADVDDTEDGAGNGDAVTLTTYGGVRVRNKSLKSRPGAQKRRAQLEALEKEWFNRNMAAMAGVGASGSLSKREAGAAAPTAPPTGVHSRWTSLKQHVLGNLEKMNSSMGSTEAQ